MKKMSWRIAAITAGAALTSAAGIAQAQTYTNDFSGGLNGITLTKSDLPVGDPNPGADIEGGTLRLTQAVNSQQNSAFLPQLNPGQAIQSFRASFDHSIAEGTCCGATPPNGPADGFSFAFGPTASGTFGEEGPATGLVISFDTWDNDDAPGAQEAPQIDIKVNGATIGTSETSPFTAGAMVPVLVSLDPDGTLDMSYGGTLIFDELVTGFTPAVGDLFSFGARTGGANEVARIDNLSITTVVPEPATLGLLGVGALGLLARRRRR